MDRLNEIELGAVSWLNGGVGWSNALDGAAYLLVSDYFIPLCICFWMLALWFRGRDSSERLINQRGVLAAAIGLGLANLTVLIINQFVFRERPLVHAEITTLLYPATDSSFPSNPAAVAFATATAIWLVNRRAALFIFVMAAVWCFMRVYNGLFFPTDILAGATIGAVVSWLVTLGLRRIDFATRGVLEGARLLRLA